MSREPDERMRPTRRDLFAGAGGALGALALPGAAAPAARADHAPPGHPGKADAKPFSFDCEPPRVRKSFHDLAEDEVRLLCEAVAYMRDGKGKEHPLSIHSPLQWDNLVSAHAHHCM